MTPARYRIRPVAPLDIRVYGLHVPAAGVEAEIGADLDLETLQLIDRTGTCRIEPLPDPEPAPESKPARSGTRSRRR